MLVDISALVNLRIGLSYRNRRRRITDREIDLFQNNMKTVAQCFRL